MPDKAPFDFSLDTQNEDFDPLADSDQDETEEVQFGEEPYTAPAPAETPASDQADEAVEPEPDDRTPQERTRDLLESMAPRRKTLLGTLAFCEEPQLVEDVNDHIDELQKGNASVYTPVILCSMLEDAGALERVTADGNPIGEEEVEPKTVVVDGVEYLEANDPADVYWRTTEAGHEVLEEDRPLERMEALLEENAKYATIYERILDLCNTSGGATIKTIDDKVDHDPLVQNPRLFAPHFVDQLESCDALVWNEEAWCITDIGRSALDRLADAAEGKQEAKEV
ncbi:MAG: hypothetical protein LUD25_05035 [Coriobacteriaceae bacterium]|nr:hypothetical protein [Coriobacteriaceae bacterium]